MPRSEETHRVGTNGRTLALRRSRPSARMDEAEIGSSSGRSWHGRTEGSSAGRIKQWELLEAAARQGRKALEQEATAETLEDFVPPDLNDQNLTKKQKEALLRDKIARARLEDERYARPRR
jgi:hypothetical protein